MPRPMVLMPMATPTGTPIRVAATRGLGFMIQSAAQFLVTDVVVMGILVIAAIAFVLEFTIRRIERVLVPWAGRE